MNPHDVKVIAATIIFSLSLAAYVILAVVAPTADYKGIFVFAGMAATSLGVSAQVGSVHHRVKRIDANTNGVLDRKIENAVRRARGQDPLPIDDDETSLP